LRVSGNYDYGFAFLLGLVDQRGLPNALRGAAVPSLFSGDTESVARGRVAPQDGDLEIGKGRRLDLAVLFLDICGFSGWLSETEQEQALVLKILNRFFPEMVRTAEEFGGTIEKNTGDGLMSWFEDSFSGRGGNGVERALLSAATMIRRNVDLVTPELRNSGFAPVQFRVALDYGPITVANLGLPKRFNANVRSEQRRTCKLLNPDFHSLSELSI